MPGVAAGRRGRTHRGSAARSGGAPGARGTAPGRAAAPSRAAPGGAWRRLRAQLGPRSREHRPRPGPAITCAPGPARRSPGSAVAENAAAATWGELGVWRPVSPRRPAGGGRRDPGRVGELLGKGQGRRGWGAAWSPRVRAASPGTPLPHPPCAHSGPCRLRTVSQCGVPTLRRHGRGQARASGWGWVLSRAAPRGRALGWAAAGSARRGRRGAGRCCALAMSGGASDVFPEPTRTLGTPVGLRMPQVGVGVCAASGWEISVPVPQSAIVGGPWCALGNP